MKIRYRIWVSTFALALLPAACLLEDIVPSQRPLVGGYLLEKANNAALPIVVYASASERNILEWDNLYFDGQGTVVRTSSIRREAVGTGEVTTNVYRLTASYQLNGRNLEIGVFSPCPPNALCTETDRGVVTVGLILMRSTAFGSNATELEYRQAGEI